MADIVQVRRARADEAPALARLMQLYLHDFSAFAPFDSRYGELDGDGLFAYAHLGAYWSEPRRELLLVRVSGRLAGFVLVNDWSASGLPVDFAIAVFFIARKFCRRGLGTEAARQVIAAREGQWEVAVLAVNEPALTFWRRVLPSAHSGAIDVIESDSARWRATIFRFANGPNVGRACAPRGLTVLTSRTPGRSRSP
ncbi:MAG: GNAT family N-acetyltransferase [Hyphomicrobiaceae bacterium]